MRARSPLPLAVGAVLLVLGCSAQEERPLTEAERTAIADTVRQLRDSIVHALDSQECDIVFPVADEMVAVISGRVQRSPPGVDRVAMCRLLNEQRLSATDEINEEEIHVLGRDAAYIVARGTYTIRWKDGRTTTRPNVATGVWSRRPEGWRLVHFHESWPADEVRSVEPAVRQGLQ